MTAAAPTNSAPSCWTRCASSTAAICAPQEMRGAWAGELGQTQFMPSSWIKYAVDFDGNGRRDLLHSAPDVLASTANYLPAMAGSAARITSPARRTSR